MMVLLQYPCNIRGTKNDEEKTNKMIKVKVATLATALVVASNSVISLQAVNNDNSNVTF